MIYFDNAATTKPKVEVLKVMNLYFTNEWYNPSALYSKAQKIKDDIEKSRKIVGDFINANSDEIFFTSGGSESNSWVLQGFINQCHKDNRVPMVITSTIEHKSIIKCLDNMNGLKSGLINVDKYGYIQLDMLEQLLKRFNKKENSKGKILVSIMFANNEIGTIQHIKEISDLVHKYDGIFHVDAVQAFGHIPIDVRKMGIDMLSASGHKIGCCKGIGFLYIKKGINIQPLIYGSQMDGMRGGTENVPYIIGMAKAVELCKANMEQNIKKTLDIRDYMIEQLQEKFNCILNGSRENRLPNNINVTFPQSITGEALIYMLDTSGILISSGSACNSNSNELSHVLNNIGLSDEEIIKTIRISLSENVTKKDVDTFLCELKKVVKLLAI